MEERYQHLVTDGYEFDFGKYMSDGWDLFKDGAGSLIGYTLVYLIIALSASAIFKQVPGLGEYYDFIGQFLSFPLSAGFYLFLIAQLNKKDEFSSFFDGFKSFKEISMFVIFYTLLSIPFYLIFFTSVIPFDFFRQMSSGNPADFESIFEELSYTFEADVSSVFVGLLVFIIGLIYLFISYSLVLPLIAISKISPWQAMETSRRIVAKNFLSFFLLYLVIGLIVIFGSVITCLLGLLVLFPWAYCVSFAVYNNIIQPATETITDQIDDFGRPETDINTESEEN